MIQYLHSNSNIITRSMFDMLQVSSRCQLWPVVFASLHWPRTEPNCPIARGRLCGESSGTSEDVGVSVADEGGYVLFLDGESPRVSKYIHNAIGSTDSRSREDRMSSCSRRRRVWR